MSAFIFNQQVKFKDFNFWDSLMWLHRWALSLFSGRLNKLSFIDNFWDFKDNDKTKEIFHSFMIHRPH